MRIYLGGHLSFYHPRKEPWLEVEITDPVTLTSILVKAGIPLGEVHLVTVNGKIMELEGTLISSRDQVRVYSPVGGG